MIYKFFKYIIIRMAQISWVSFFFVFLCVGSLLQGNTSNSGKPLLFEQNDSLNFQSGYQEFIEEHAFKELFIVFAGPYPSSPSSSFGHIFLLLKPKVERKSILLWDVINFGANSDSLNIWDTFYKGILGGLVGHYSIIPFHEKIREYTFIESRALWLYPVRLNSDESSHLLFNLFKNKNKSFDYRFFTKNCASQIESLLEKSFGRSIEKNSVLISPRDVLLKNTEIKKRIGKPLYIESVEQVIDSYFEEKSVNAIDWLLVPDSFKVSMHPDDAAILLTILEWKYYRRKKMLIDSEKKQIQFLRLAASKRGGEGKKK